MFLVTLGLFCAFDVLWWCLWCLRCARDDVPFTAVGCCGTEVADFSVAGAATVPFFEASVCRTLKKRIWNKIKIYKMYKLPQYLFIYGCPGGSQTKQEYIIHNIILITNDIINLAIITFFFLFYKRMFYDLY